MGIIINTFNNLINTEYLMKIILTSLYLNLNK